MSFPNSKTRRGRVIDGGDTCPTLDTDCMVGVIIDDRFPGSRDPRFYSEYAPTIKGGKSVDCNADRADIRDRKRTKPTGRQNIF